MEDSPDSLCEKTRNRAADAGLVRRASDGDLEAFEELIGKYQRGIFSVALYKSKNYFDAEDLTQDIFLAAFKALPTLKVPENFSSWIFGIAYNRCHKWFRREKTKILKFAEIKQRVAQEEGRRQREASRIGAPPGPSATTTCGQSSGAEKSEDHLSEHLRRLPSEIRDVLSFKYLEGLSYQEIEHRMGINANRIDYLIRKGKQMLRTRVEREVKAW